jgi:peptidyl-prolyl cis-trans isomerase B (cyclophilin B)
MTPRSNRQRSAARLALAGLGLALGLAGCGRQAPATDDGKSKPAAAGASANPTAAPGQGQLADRLHVQFAQAVLLEPPEEQERPPDRTKAGKSVGKLFEVIAGQNNQGSLWDQVKFVTPEGKRINYAARIKTDLGDVVIRLWPDVAPNHVRNFVALAWAGYYDGLEFDRLHREELIADQGGVFEYVEAGCPSGTGSTTGGSIGYWLRAELSPVAHEPGTVGAWHNEPQDSAACKFYIMLTRAPWMDNNFTVFGKVVEGLDVVRKISGRPKFSDDPLEDRPQEPVVMRQVTLEVAESARAFGPTD